MVAVLFLSAARAERCRPAARSEERFIARNARDGKRATAIYPS